MEDRAISLNAVLKALRTCYDTEIVEYDNGDEYISYGQAIAEIEQLPPVTPLKQLREEMRIAQKGITDEKVLLGFNMAVALCNKHLGGDDNESGD